MNDSAKFLCALYPFFEVPHLEDDTSHVDVDLKVFTMKKAWNISLVEIDSEMHHDSVTIKFQMSFFSPFLHTFFAFLGLSTKSTRLTTMPNLRCLSSHVAIVSVATLCSEIRCRSVSAACQRRISAVTICLSLHFLSILIFITFIRLRIITT